jgi:hypothetical protein
MNHTEAYELACIRKEDSNLAKCYIDLFDFINDDLQIVEASLLNMLEMIKDSEESSQKVDATKAIEKMNELMKKVKNPCQNS